MPEEPEAYEQNLPIVGADDVTGLLITILTQKTSADPRFGSILTQLKNRQQIGISRYGRSLETFNGRDALQDLEEELIDGLQYLTQVRLETEATLRNAAQSARYLLASYERENSQREMFDVAVHLRETLYMFAQHLAGRTTLFGDTHEALRLYLTEYAEVFSV